MFQAGKNIFVPEIKKILFTVFVDTMLILILKKNISTGVGNFNYLPRDKEKEKLTAMVPLNVKHML